MLQGLYIAASSHSATSAIKLIPTLTKIPSSSPGLSGFVGERLPGTISPALSLYPQITVALFVNPKVVEVPADAARMAISADTPPQEKSDSMLLADCV